MAATVAIRVWGAWRYRHAVNLDHATVALMARHMAEGSDFPVFFHGQAFMGSLEPMISAALCRIFGTSGFMVNMGAALLGIILSVVLYFRVRGMAGRTAAAASVLFLAIGPRGYFHYLASPRCYAIQMLLSVLLLRVCSDGVRALRRNDPFPSKTVFLWGLLAGIGWWSSGQVLVTLGACGLLVLICGGRRLWTWRWIWGLPGALLGASPWIVWTLRNGFYSLWAQGGMLAVTGIGRRLFVFLGNRMFRILGVHALPAPLNYILGAVLVLAVLAACCAVISRQSRWVERERKPDLAACLLLFPSAAFFFSLSLYGDLDTARYHLPLVPAVAVCLGILPRALTRRMGAWGWIPVAGLVATQIPNLPQALATSRAEAVRAVEAGRLLDFMTERDLTAACGAPPERWMTFHFREKAVMVPFRGGGYQPHADRAELAESVAILNDYSSFSSFLLQAGGTAKVHRENTLRLHHDLQPPPASAIHPVALRGISCEGGQDWTDALTDFNSATGWPAPEGRTLRALTLDMDSREMVAGVRLIFHSARIPAAWRIRGLPADSNDWISLLEEVRATPCHWSGDRVYGPGSSHRLEARFEAGRFERIRIELSGPARPPAWTLQELQMLTPAETLAPGEIEEVLSWLSAAGFHRIYADRSMAARIRRDGWAESPDPFYFRERERDGFDKPVRIPFEWRGWGLMKRDFSVAPVARPAGLPEGASRAHPRRRTAACQPAGSGGQGAFSQRSMVSARRASMSASAIPHALPSRVSRMRAPK